MIRALFFVLLFVPAVAGAQTGHTGPAGAAELTVGAAGFVDERLVGHGVWGGAARIYITPRLSAGPEFVYMQGTRGHHDLFVTGNLTFDLTGAHGRQRVTPFLVAGGGLMRITDRFASSTFTSTEGAFTAGGGVRVRVAERVLVGGEFRGGWEPHMRVTGTMGVGF